MYYIFLIYFGKIKIFKFQISHSSWTEVDEWKKLDQSG